MRVLIFACVAILALAVEGKVVQLGTVTPVIHYHEAVGIPLAASIKAEEDQLFNSQTPDNNRIVGGAVAPTNAYPFLAGLVITFVNTAGQSACGSSLLSSNRLVTAAHCWYDGQNQARQFEVVLGSDYLFYYGTRIATSQVYTHPQYSPQTISDDVAVIYLPNSVSFTAAIQPINLPSSNQLSNTFDGQWAVAAGYGKTTDLEVGVSANTVKRHVNVRVISNAECVQSFGTFVRTSNICTSGSGYVGVCGGDSGGPLILNQGNQNILIGVTSFAAKDACHLGYPSGFARVTSFYSFITQHL